MLVNWNCLCFSLFLGSRTLTLIVVDSWFKIEEFLHEMPISLKSGRVKQNNHSSLANWPDRALTSQHLQRFLDILSVNLCLSSTVPLRSLLGLRPPPTSFVLSLHLTMPTVTLSVLLKAQLQEGVLSSCGCSLTLTLTTSIGIWHGAGATKSWSSVLSLSCSCRISLCILSNYDSGGWATRVIHFSLLVSSTVSTTLILQKTISLAIRNHLSRHPIEGRFTFRDIYPALTRIKRVNLLQSTVHQTHSLAKSKALAVP